MAYTPSKIGQIVVPISPRAISGLDAQAIADEVAPVVIDAAARLGGAPVGAPELLREDELRSRTDHPEILATLDAHPGRLWLVAEMVPIDQASEVARSRPSGPAIELVLPPVRLPQGRRGRG